MEMNPFKPLLQLLRELLPRPAAIKIPEVISPEEVMQSVAKVSQASRA